MSNIRKIKQGKLTLWFGIEQGTQEWLELRADKATCSNAFGLCFHGKNFSKTANEQHALRTTPNGNQYAERGHVYENEVKEKIIEEFVNENSRFEVLNCSFIMHDDYPNAGYSPDAILVDKATGEFYMPIEVKCFNDITERWIDKKKGLKKFVRTNKHKKCCESLLNVPFEYRMQFQMEMLMTDTDTLLLVLYNPDAEQGVPVIKFHVVERDEVYINRIKERLLEKC